MRTMNEIMDGLPSSLNNKFLGRGTLRRDATSQNAVRIPVWGLTFQPKTPGARFERAYTDALATLDDFEDLAAATRKSGKFTAAGVAAEIGQHC
jgi:hypothetical protein